ncbi:MAG: hypothetical protein KC417_02175, partial [Myxococcales bacterium]|nr:hypothetical protein [Myxococcales bacterium]
MHAARPTSNTVPCATCGERVDALRAPRVRATETTLLLFCGDQCAKLYRPTNSVSPATAVRDPSGVHRTAEPAPELAQSPRIAAITAPPADVPWVALSLAGAGLVSAVLAHWFPALAIPSAVLSASAAVGAGWLHSAEARYIGWLPTLIGPAGAMVAAASAMVPETAGGAPVARLVGAALAGFAVVHRAWVDTRASQPVRALLEELESSVPRSGQMIAAGDTFDGVVPRKIIGVDAARRGESIVVHAEGQIAVDGVVQSGSAVVQRHPFDPTPVIRTEGQTIVAGARVLEGELR